LGAVVAWGGGRQVRQQRFEIEIKIGVGLKILPLLPGWWWVNADCDIDFDFVFARRVGETGCDYRPVLSGSNAGSVKSFKCC